MRAALVLVALVACQNPPDHAADPAVGRWRGQAGHTIELHADGTLDMDPIVAAECMNAPLAPCKSRQRWTRSGSIVALSRGSVSGPQCTCRIERIDVQLRGDELVSGTEHAERVKSAN